MSHLQKWVVMVITGIDLASVHSAICTLEVPTPKSWHDDKWDAGIWSILELDWIDVKEDSTSARIQAAYAFLSVVREYMPELVVIEDYTHQKKSFDSYNVGELGGMLRLLLWQNKYPQLYISPMRLKMFLNHHGKTPIAKEDVAFSVQAYFNYKSDASQKKKREDATDAFALAQLGRIFQSHQVYAGNDSAMLASLNEKQQKVLASIWDDRERLVLKR